MYLELASLPVPTAARFLGPEVIHVNLSTRDHVRNVKRSTSKSIFVTPTSVSSSLSQDIADVVASTVSPSGARLAILRESEDSGAGKKKRYVEIWAGDALEASQEVTSTHGAFYADDYLSSLSFSPSESALLYTAEANPPEDSYEKFRFTPQFGEGLTGKKRPTIYLFRWRDPRATTTATPSVGQKSQSTSTALAFAQPQTLPTLLGQAVFCTENRIFATGYEYTADGRLLGIKGCYNRPSGIWEMTIPPSTNAESDSGSPALCTAVKLSPSHRSCRSPRVLTDGATSTLFWLSNEAGGAHASCASLHRRDLNSNKETTIVDTVWDPREDGFPGLYPDSNLPAYPFLKLDLTPYIITHSTWRSRSTVLLIRAEDGHVKDLTPDDVGMLYSWTVLGTDGKNQVLCSRSAPAVPHELVLGRIKDSGAISWQVIDKPNLKPEVESALSTLKGSVISIPGRYPTETVVLQRRDQINPCITIPHGGPHATTTTSFWAATVSLALEGYTVSSPNYTGSLGFGETYVRKLLGNCGTLDVEDCIASVRHLVSLRIAEDGPGKQFIQGGSHGGFLTAHLIGQYPEVFTAAVLRNPVISCGEISGSDLPDWYYAEFGLPFTSTSLITPGIFEKLQRASPIHYVDAVRVPVLLLLGEVDQRVAPTQGIGYYHALKGRGRDVEMLCFPKDSHPLDGVEAQRVGWEAGRDWFKKSQKI